MTSLQTPKLVIFDCDGVLVDSEELANRVLVGMLTSHGLNLSLDEAIRFFSGFTPEDTVAKAEGMLGRALPKNFWQETQSKTFSAFKSHLQPIAGAVELVMAVMQGGMKVCVASSGAHKKLELTLGLTGLDELFGQYVFSAEDVARGKPAPDLFLFVAGQMRIDPAECLVIEDSRPGIEAAQVAGMRPILFDPDGRHGIYVRGVTRVIALDQVHNTIG